MKKFIKAAAVIAAAVITFCLPSCAKGKQTYSRYIYAMGTFARVVAPCGSEEEFTSFADEVEGVISGADSSLSATDENSYVCAFNSLPAGGEMEVDKTFYDVINLSLEMYAFTDGYYNPAVYHSVKAFGFPQSVAPQAFPDGETLAAFVELSSHFGEIETRCSDGKYFVKKPDCTAEVGESGYTLAIDLGGIGKGWCADRADELFARYGYEYGYFDFSSSSMSLESYAGNSDGNYDVRLRDPRAQDGEICSVKVKGEKLSTSGDYEHFYEVEGKRYCHIINPFTGEPLDTGVQSVTIIGGSAAQGDALTTALSCMGRDAAVEFIKSKLKDRIAIIVVENGGNREILSNRPEEIKNAACTVIGID